MTQLSKNIEIVEKGNNSIFRYTAPDRSSIIDLEFGGGLYVNGTEITDSVVGDNPVPVARTSSPIVGTNDVNANIELLDAAIGVTPSVTTRTVGPILAANAVNANITALDVAIGTDAQLTAVSRTVGPIAAAQSINQNIDDLDAAIGADVTPITRTVGVIAIGASVNANIDALDTAIGGDSQIAGQAKNIAAANSVIQNLQSLDTYKTVRTIKKTIGAPSFGGTDYNFSSAANQTEQVITLTNVVPAKARIVDVMVYCDAIFTNAVSMAVDVGTTSGGGELVTSGSVYSAGQLIASPNAGAFIATPSGTASNIYVNATPGANWDQFTAGSMSVFITIIDLNQV